MPCECSYSFCQSSITSHVLLHSNLPSESSSARCFVSRFTFPQQYCPLVRVQWMWTGTWLSLLASGVITGISLESEHRRWYFRWCLWLETLNLLLLKQVHLTFSRRMFSWHLWSQQKLRRALYSKISRRQIPFWLSPTLESWSHGRYGYVWGHSDHSRMGMAKKQPLHWLIDWFDWLIDLLIHWKSQQHPRTQLFRGSYFLSNVWDTSGKSKDYRYNHLSNS